MIKTKTNSCIMCDCDEFEILTETSNGAPCGCYTWERALKCNGCGHKTRFRSVHFASDCFFHGR